MNQPAVQANATTLPPNWVSVRRIAQMLGVVAFSATLMVTLIAFLARWSPIAEIVSHFRVVYALVSVAALACLLASRSWRWSLGAALLTLWHGGAVGAWYLPAAAAGSGGREIRVLTSNVNSDTDGYARLLEVIAHEDPDLIFLQELSLPWAQALEVIHTDYPYRIISPRLDYFGLGFYSRFPIENIETNDPIYSNLPLLDPVYSDVPITRGDVIVDGRRIHIINAHLAPPENRMFTALRYKQFNWLTGYLEAHEGPAIVAGDFNCTMWSPLYHDLVERGRLSNARQGHGVLASWYPLPGSLNLIPIDQILGRGVQFTGANLTARIGSDHVPLAATLRIPE